MPLTAADNGAAQTVTATATLFYDIAVSGRPAQGILVSCATANANVYTDTLGTFANPIVIVAGAPPIQLTDLGGGIKKAWGFGPTNAALTWATNIR
jgi:hypothetical protein